ncbi:SgrR family transcriptional regulator [Paenibacillus sp. KQZ6P-2]|uniref:SgrR family transcriptional regulator n=1 Tax=Paenibacillus mangrovi TaxID=2931978 RepID=A0A9X1WLC0_9BACL|nr:SgrR family transcriptional regulator [Paenibacillus mangrovi]MCJ8011004.1 SgrR family transcriptional regulator [Paenibacillus mangrovi]
MLLNQQYLMLYDRFSEGKESGIPIQVTLGELSAALFCTVRNAKLILRKLVEEQLIEWLPGRGRGNYSQITFHAGKEDFLFNLSVDLAKNGEYKQAFEVLSEYGGGTLAKDRFLNWLSGHFGYKKEEGTEGLPASDTLIFPVLKSPRTLDPAEANYAFDSHLQRQIFDRLLSFDEQLERIVPGIAHHWKSDKNATEWTFYLRKGVRFHNGQELTSKDVAYTFERLRRGTQNEWLLREVAGIETLGPQVVRIRLLRPNRIFDRFMCSVGASILPFELAGLEEEKFWNLPIGTGPFKLVSYSKHRIELVANNHYYEGRPYLDGVDIVILPEDCDPETIGYPTILHTWGRFRQEEQYAQGDDQETSEKLRQACTILSWNLNRNGPQQSEAFRRAVRMIIHPGDMIAELGGARILPAFGFRPEEGHNHVIDPLRPERVRSALKEAAYDGAVVHISVFDKYREDAEWIQKRLADWGIRTELQNYKTWQDADLTISSIVLAEDEVCEIETYENRSSVLKTYLDKERLSWITERINDALSADSVGTRRLILREIEQHLRDEASVIFLHHRQLNAFLHPFVRGISLNALGWIDFKDVWLEKHD